MNPEQQRLLEKAERSLQAATELNQKGFAEFAASRGYYAMFYVATAFLEGEGLAYSKHSAVIAAFGEKFARPQRVPREFHRYLIDAERTRLRGDYNTDPNILLFDYHYWCRDLYNIIKNDTSNYNIKLYKELRVDDKGDDILDDDNYIIFKHYWKYKIIPKTISFSENTSTTT
jgi:uncharacterized protein (UPF0332 family)